ncbi:MAG: ABC transporter permease subunit [Candidatus Symbiodolus clandestinus]
MVDNFNQPIVEALTRTTINIPPDKGLWQHACYRFRCNRLAMFSLLLLLLVVAWTLLVPLFSPFGYDEIDWKNFWLQPNFTSGHYFGTDILGRDLLVRTAIGGCISLSIGIIGAMTVVLIGTFYGFFSGYFGGWITTIIWNVLEILDTIPLIFLVTFLASYFTHSILPIFFIISAFYCFNIARIVRGQTYNLKQKEFILTATVSGTTSINIIMRHIFPNVLGISLVHGSLLISPMILFESSISFLGVGVQEPLVSLGSLIQSATGTLEYAPWNLLFPGSYLALILWCFNIISDALRDALDPQNY